MESYVKSLMGEGARQIDVYRKAASFANGAAVGMGNIGKKYDTKRKSLRQLRKNRNADPDKLTERVCKKLRELALIEQYECNARILLGHFILRRRGFMVVSNRRF